MSNSDKAPLSADPWQQLRNFTRARIALGRVGSSLPTTEVLDFGMAHAMARDAVHLALDTGELSASLQAAGYSTCLAHSRAQDRQTYLLRPDLGSRLDDASLIKLKAIKLPIGADLLIVVGDGLSSLAVKRHVLQLLEEIGRCMPTEWKLGDIVIVRQARVAISDEIAATLGARMVVMLIGERPGLSSPDSLGIYLTFSPKVGRSNAERNCISNVRPEGLSYSVAAQKLVWLARRAMQLKLSGVELKDQSEPLEIDLEHVPTLLG